MTWYDTKQAAVDPDNPAANEQIPFSEWNAMVTYLKDKIIDKAVNDAAIANNRVLVYKTATSTFVFEDQSAVAAINDLTDVVISGVPADNEVLAYNTATSKWINQTAAEAGLATVAGLASYYPLSGGTLTGNLNMGDYLIDDVDDIQAYDTSGINCRDSVAASKILLATTTYSFFAMANASMDSHKIIWLTDPDDAQDAATKNYADTRVATKELVTNFTNDYVLIYKTASGKFEMEEQSAALGLPVVDTTAIIKGSADGTKQIRFEVDGLTTGTTRIMTVPDKDITLCGTDEVLMNPATESLDMDGNQILNVSVIGGQNSTGWVQIHGGSSIYDAEIRMFGKDTVGTPGDISFDVPNAAKTSQLTAMNVNGATDTPIVDINYGLDMNAKIIYDPKNSAASALSGTQKDIEIDIGGTPYYFTVYPTKA